MKRETAPRRFGRLPPLGLYVHIPWCVRKCPYCDFNSHAADGSLPEADYVEALLDDLLQDLPLAQDRPLQSLFIGGGTPSLFSADAIARLLEGIGALLPFTRDIEITLEANPGAADQARFRGYRAAGVNRLSLGIQSFDDARLRALGRIHDAEAADRAIEAARAAGFDNFNLDLMFGLPQQSIEAALADLHRAIDHRPTHLSWYQLTIEPNTAFHKRPPPLPDDELLWPMQQQGQRLLAAAGFEQYEISAYCQPQRHSKHNLNYWKFGDYLGIGAGAHGKITLGSAQQVIRTRKSRQPRHYLDHQKSYLAGKQVLNEADLPLEFLMNGLRLNSGVSSQSFVQRTGLPLSSIDGALLQAREKGLLEEESTRLNATLRGRQYLNSLLELFL